MNTTIIENKNSGFSLVEMIVYIAIFSLFVIVLANFSSTLTSTRLHTQMVIEVNDQGSSVIKTITQTLRNASSINSSSIGNTSSSLSLTTITRATSPTIFSLSGGVLYITEGSGSPVALTNNKVVASNLAFSNFSRPSTPNIITISFTLTSKSANTNAGGPYTITFSDSGALRK